ncbi:MAG TPA: hypothetical protein DCS93_02325 [Microscillaceae bacterium]|nr:hypothetical protein [Microscillaceae bacterium]
MQDNIHKGGETEQNSVAQNKGNTSKQQTSLLQTKLNNQSAIQTQQGNKPIVQAKQNGKPPVQTKQGRKPPIQAKQNQKPPVKAKQRPVQRKEKEHSIGNEKVTSRNNLSKGDQQQLEAQAKANVSKVTGVDVHDAQVTFDSQRPIQLNANATAQGLKVDIGPQQENHLEHELGHVAQNKKQPVQANKQTPDGTLINDEKDKEKYADEVDVKAKQLNEPVQAKSQRSNGGVSSIGVVQAKFKVGAEQDGLQGNELQKLLDEFKTSAPYLKLSKINEIWGEGALNIEEEFNKLAQNDEDIRVHQNAKNDASTYSTQSFESIAQKLDPILAEKVNPNKLKDYLASNSFATFLNSFHSDNARRFGLGLNDSGKQAMKDVIDNRLKDYIAEKESSLFIPNDEILNHDKEGVYTKIQAIISNQLYPSDRQIPTLESGKRTEMQKAHKDRRVAEFYEKMSTIYPQLAKVLQDAKQAITRQQEQKKQQQQQQSDDSVNVLISNLETIVSEKTNLLENKKEEDVGSIVNASPSLITGLNELLKNVKSKKNSNLPTTFKGILPTMLRELELISGTLSINLTQTRDAILNTLTPIRVQANNGGLGDFIDTIDDLDFDDEPRLNVDSSPVSNDQVVNTEFEHYRSDSLFKLVPKSIKSKRTHYNYSTEPTSKQHYHDKTEVLGEITDDMKPSDIRQQRDSMLCFLLAALARLVELNQGFVKSMFTNANKDNNTVTIRLFDLQGKPVYITVDRTQVKANINDTNKKIIETGTPITLSGQHAEWVQLIEKAYILAGFEGVGGRQYAGKVKNETDVEQSLGIRGLHLPQGGGGSEIAMQHITGRKSDRKRLSSYSVNWFNDERMNVGELKAALDAGQVVTTAFSHDIQVAGLSKGHVYSIVGYKGEQFILRNPSGKNVPKQTGIGINNTDLEHMLYNTDEKDEDTWNEGFFVLTEKQLEQYTKEQKMTIGKF